MDAHAPGVDLTFFGPPTVTLQPSGKVVLLNRKTLALLAYLAVESEHAHSRETLIGLLWPDLPDADARNNLRVAWSALRQCIPDPGPKTPILHSTRLELQFLAHPAIRVDVSRFGQLLAACDRHVHPRREACPDCLARLSEAAALYQGEFLSGFQLEGCPTFDEWMSVQRERRHVRMMTLLNELAHTLEAAENVTLAVAFARRQIELDPLQEIAHRRLMRGLDKLGQRNQALAQYQVCKKILAAELGVAPDAETTALYEQIRAGLVPSKGPAGSPPTVTLTVPLLPAASTPFFGREQELAQVALRASMPQNRLLSFVGPGGIGKTRLAIEAALVHQENFPDGVFFIPLGAVPSTDAIPGAIAAQLGLSFTPGDTSPARQLIHMLAPRHVLLILDEFEHLMEGVDFLVRLLQETRHVTLFVTSRERLNIQMEDLFELRGLAVPGSGGVTSVAGFAAVRMFVDHAHRLNKAFRLTDDLLAPIAHICQVIDGLPLAIELAAALTRDLSCDEIAAELGRGLDLLESTRTDVAPAHRSLRAVFQSSFQALSAAERLTLGRLTIFRGGFSGEAAREIAGATTAQLAALRNKSLLYGAGSRRYDMHAMIRTFAAEALAADAADAAALAREHSHFFLNTLAAHTVALDTHASRVAADRIQADWDNVMAAWGECIRRADLTPLHGTALALARFCDLRGRYQAATVLFEDALAAARVGSEGKPAGSLLECQLLTQLAYFSGLRGLPNTRQFAESALALARSKGSELDMITNLLTLATNDEVGARYAQATDYAEAALHLAETVGHEPAIGSCLTVLGTVAMQTAAFDRANQLFHRVVEINKKTGRIDLRARAAIGYLSGVATDLGHYDVALRYAQQHLAESENHDDRRNIAKALHYLAFLWMRLGCFEKAIELDAQAYTRAGEVGDRELASYAAHAMACAQRHNGQPEQALASARLAVQIAREFDAPLAVAFGMGQLGEAQLCQTEPDWVGAEVNLRAAIDTMRAIGKLVVSYEAEIGLAELFHRRGRHLEARALVSRLVPHLPTLAADGWDEPIRAYALCARVLLVGHDPLAARIIRQGQHLLACLAEKISDPIQRTAFVENGIGHDAFRAVARDVAFAGPAPPNNLPEEAGNLIGRTIELQTIHELVLCAQRPSSPAGSVRLITLVGPGGVGKTRLMLHAARALLHYFEDGICLVELSGVAQPGAVVRAAAAALLVPEQSGQALEGTLCAALAGRSLLLLLDNCEHVLETSAHLAQTLLGIAPRLVVVATSRVPLGVAGEYVLRIHPLRSPPMSEAGPTLADVMAHDAVQLFVNCARAALPSIQLTESQAPDLAAVCRELDGLPLAIELAAAGLRSMPLDRLAQTLRTAGGRQSPPTHPSQPSHGSLHDLVAWSYDLCTPSERVVLRRLGVFGGDFSLAAAAGICNMDEMRTTTFHDVMLSLTNQSLLVHPVHAPRWSLLNSIRQFANGRLNAAGESHVTSRRHAGYFAAELARLAPLADGPDHRAALRVVEAEHHNIAAALDWCLGCEPTLAAQLAVNLSRLNYWEFCGRYEEAHALHLGLLAPGLEFPNVLRADVLLGAARLAAAQTHYSVFQDLAERAAALFTTLGDEVGRLRAEFELARVSGLRGQVEPSNVALRDILARADRIGARTLAGQCEYALGGNAYVILDLDHAELHWRRAVAIFRQLGDQMRLVYAMQNVANLSLTRKQPEAALPLYTEALQLSIEFGHRRATAHVQTNLGLTLINLGHFDRARALLEDGLRARRDMGLLLGVAFSLLSFSELACALGRFEHAALVHGAAVGLHGRIGHSNTLSEFGQTSDLAVAIKRALDPRRFTTLWDQGRTLATGAAIDRALNN